ncbi:MAG: alpha/beta hydrolase-fold protein [Actinomycetota bacterium]|jgi:pimeloyl-ACP methyl ester carboxylesterase|nr:alpha/beta hydrolase-fold protein [Actinomycetota bacterium]
MAAVPRTRRAFLLGAGAAVLAAGCGGSGGEEVSGSFASRYMPGRVGWTISLPAGKPAGVLVCLNGYGGNHRWAFDLGVPAAAASVGLHVAVAGVDGGHDSYWHRRANGTDAQAMLLREFLPLVRRRVGGVPCGLMGWSMGGYGALLAAEVARADFVALAVASPALWLAPADTAPGAFDSPADFYANDVWPHLGRLEGMAVSVACGTSDPFYPVTRVLVADMHFPHHVWFAPGGHDAAFWRAAAPVQLRAIAGAFRRSPPTA